MSGYGVKEARIKGDHKPTTNTCGGCGDECNGLLCDECRAEIAGVTNYENIGKWESDDEQARRTR